MMTVCPNTIVLSLKSPILTTRKGFFRDKVPKFSSKLTENVSNSSSVWLGDLYRTTKLQSLSFILNSKFIIHSCRYWMSRTRNGKNFYSMHKLLCSYCQKDGRIELSYSL